jgi:hypothetical protein
MTSTGRKFQKWCLKKHPFPESGFIIHFSEPIQHGNSNDLVKFKRSKIPIMEPVSSPAKKPRLCFAGERMRKAAQMVGYTFDGNFS